MMTPLGTCDQAGCKVAETGQCMEGLSLSAQDKCPHFLSQTVESRPSEEVLDGSDELDTGDEDTPDDDWNDDQAPSTAILTTMYSLHSGEELNRVGALDVIRAVPTRLIILAGDSDSGKTTILACLNQCFQRGPYAGYLFARSRTMVAFERVCHESRLTSGRTKPDTARTGLGNGARFLHLAVRQEDLSAPQRHLLFTNLPGEDFTRVKDLKEEALGLDFIHRANHFVLVIDGSRLVELSRRTKVRNHARQTLRRLIESDLLGQHSQVDVLISKWDCVQDALIAAEDVPSEVVEEKRVMRVFLDDTETIFREQFESQLGRLRFFNIAARPHLSSDLPEGYGLDGLFRSWVEDASPITARNEERSMQDGKVLSSSVRNRESTRFTWRPQLRPVKSIR